MLYGLPNVIMYITCFICSWSVKEFIVKFFHKKFLFIGEIRQKVESECPLEGNHYQYNKIHRINIEI